jgi:nucleoside-diphosphate-sugar epimerase
VVRWKGGVENMERLKILITGATGFIGANLAHFLLSNGNDVAVTARNASNTWRIDDIKEDLTIFPMDITNLDDVKAIFTSYKPDVVINTAAYGGYHFEKNIWKIFNVNLNGTMNLVENFLKSNSSILINTGSSSEYGFKERAMQENDHLDPYGSYAVSKAASTLYCRSRSLEENRKIVTLRLFSAYGYYEESHRLIPYILTSAMESSKLQLNNPNNVRDFIFIEDILQAYVRIIERMDSINGGEIFNVGSGLETSVNRIVEIAENITGQELKIEWKHSEERIGDKAIHWVADISKITRELNWKPTYSLEEGLSKTYRWLKENVSKYGVMENSKIKRNI